ncbi:MAG: ATP-binding protein [Solirubrobacteraceae bacterium]
MSGPDPVLSAAPWERHVLADPPAVVPTLRRELVAYARFLGASDRTCDAIALAVSEALTNIVRHAYVGQEPGPIIVEALLEGRNQLLLRVSDEGRGPTPRADSPGLGLGLGVMAQTADDFSISNRQETRGTVVTLGFSLPDCDPISQEWVAARNVDRNVHS